MTEKQRTFEAGDCDVRKRTYATLVPALQKMSLQPRSMQEKATTELQNNPLPEESLSSPASVTFSREVLLRLINRLKHS
jgi:hypothetical protein